MHIVMLCYGNMKVDKLNNMKGQYIIVDLNTMEYFKTVEGEMMFFDTDEDALLHCGIYELPNAWVMKLIYNHIEQD